MANPVAPSQFKTVVPSSSGTVCDKFVKAFKTFPQLFTEFYSWMYNEDGTFSLDFEQMICGIDCNAVGSTGGGGTGGLGTPTIVFSSTSNTFVRLSWNAIAGAGNYEIWRGTTYNLLAAAYVGVTANTTFDDTAVTGSTYYYYWVRAITNTNQGGFSAVQVAFTSTSSSLALATPTVVPTNGTIAAYVQSTWGAIQGASDYTLLRNNSNTTVGATSLVTTKQLEFSDYTAFPATAYYYFIRANNQYNSATSAGVLGARS